MSNPRLYQLNTQTGTLVLTGANIGLNVVHNAVFSSNVGIGTTNPTSIFTIKGRGHSTPSFAIHRTDSATEQFTIYNAEGTSYTSQRGTASGVWTNVLESRNSNLMLTTNNVAGTGGSIILDANNVGIGTTNPTIFGGGLEVSRASQAGVRVSATGGANPTAIEIGADSTGNGYVQTVTANARIQFFTNLANVTTMTLTSTGNVGIGTTNPSQRLSVFGSGMVAGFTSNTTTGSITIAHSGNGGTIGYTNSGAGSLSNMFYITTGAGTVGSGIVMDNGGNVGIGTPTPGTLHKLAVQGPTRLKRLQQQVYSWYTTSGSAYVHFKTNLKLTGSGSQVGMWMWRFHGYSYGTAKTVDSYFGLHSDGSGNIYSAAYQDQGEVAFCTNMYKSSDNFLVIVGAIDNTYFFGIDVDIHHTMDYAYSDLNITAVSQSASTSGVY